MAGSGAAHLRDGDDVFLRAENVTVTFPAGRGGRRLQAVADVSLDLLPGETLGLVGESGCGKSSLARALMQIPPPTSGTVRLGDVDLTKLSKRALKQVRPRMQMIFQDPISSLNPRRRVADIVEEPLKIWRRGDATARRDAVEQVLRHVGLRVEDARSRRPHEFSGGQCQRISIARALVLEPELVICDEPVSALDVSVQAQILNLLEDMKERYALTMLFIAHDLAVVKHISDRIAVMYLGKLCEVTDPDTLHARPAHPYTSALLQSIPTSDPERMRRERIDVGRLGEPPSPLDPPSGCRFRTRCPRAAGICAEREPELRRLDDGQVVACHFPVAPGEPV